MNGFKTALRWMKGHTFDLYLLGILPLLHMKLLTPISILLLAGCLTTLVSCNRNQDAKDNDAYLARNMLEYTILNESLKNELIQYDNRFKDFEEAQNKGLTITLSEVFRDSIKYTITYSTGLNSGNPVILCEPIDGKPVILELAPLYGEFELPVKKAIELVKYSNPEEYEMHKSYIDNFEIVDGDTMRPRITVLSDFVNLILVYDRDYNLIRRDTIGWY